MSEAAAAAPSAPAEAQGTATATDTGTEAQAAPEAAQERQRQRIEMAKLHDDDAVVMVVDGREVEMTAAEARRLVQSNAAATKRFQEAAKKQRDAEEILTAVTQTLGDPRALYRELAAAGLSPRQIADTFLQLEAEEAAMTPEQRRVRELEAERERMLAEREQQAAQQRNATVARREQVFTSVFANAINDAGLSDLPQEVKDDCAWAFKALVEEAEANGRQLKRADVAEAMKQAARARAMHYARLLDDDALLPLMTPERLAKVQAAQLAQVKQVTNQAPALPRDARTGQFQSPSTLAQDVNGRRVLRGGVDSLFR